MIECILQTILKVNYAFTLATNDTALRIKYEESRQPKNEWLRWMRWVFVRIKTLDPVTSASHAINGCAHCQIRSAGKLLHLHLSCLPPLLVTTPFAKTSVEYLLAFRPCVPPFVESEMLRMKELGKQWHSSVWAKRSRAENVTAANI